ncbi:hypothetical protein NC653_027685 [Populus alba x Populus x berolinensis]|uniref:Uncharacterized protein n=1 Tax=Populus alba x Populus x berolinensis TaxID=444605 RepID=A0AAD6M5Y7_9ROSI|nr:hypothetical protein NC653_027685 [Populus alba x Populus x berolinensis]
MISNEEANQVPHYGTPQFNVADKRWFFWGRCFKDVF